MIRGGYHVLRTIGSALLGTLQVVGFEGKGEPGPRSVNEKQKAKNRRRRKLARAQRRSMR